MQKQQPGMPAGVPGCCFLGSIINAAINCFKNATGIADKYHVFRQVNWPFEHVRKEVQKQFHQERRLYFLRSRRVLPKRFKDMKDEERLQVEAKRRLPEWNLPVGT